MAIKTGNYNINYTSLKIK